MKSFKKTIVKSFLKKSEKKQNKFQIFLKTNFKSVKKQIANLFNKFFKDDFLQKSIFLKKKQISNLLKNANLKEKITSLKYFKDFF